MFRFDPTSLPLAANGICHGGSLGIFTVSYSGYSVSALIQAVIDGMNAIAARTNSQGPGFIAVNGHAVRAVWIGGGAFGLGISPGGSSYISPGLTYSSWAAGGGGGTWIHHAERPLSGH